jgi:hypothetical protein
MGANIGRLYKRIIVQQIRSLSFPGYKTQKLCTKGIFAIVSEEA